MSAILSQIFLQNPKQALFKLKMIEFANVLQGVPKVFIHLKCAVCGELVHLNFFLRKYQMKKSIIPTLSENFNEMKQTWH